MSRRVYSLLISTAECQARETATSPCLLDVGLLTETVTDASNETLTDLFEENGDSESNQLHCTLKLSTSYRERGRSSDDRSRAGRGGQTNKGAHYASALGLATLLGRVGTPANSPHLGTHPSRMFTKRQRELAQQVPARQTN